MTDTTESMSDAETYINHRRVYYTTLDDGKVLVETHPMVLRAKGAGLEEAIRYMQELLNEVDRYDK